ncbi:MAG TPA: hypothetical protein VGO59_09770 [Verrucomicrobiae bacterium]|jgi:subtilase family serine protease
MGIITSVGARPFRLFEPPARGTVRPPLWLGHGPEARPESIGNNAAAPYTPQQVQNAYGFTALYSAGYTGAGQTIAIVDAYDDSQYAQADLNTFCSEFGLATTTVQVVYGSGSKPAANSGWQQEMSLDVQWAHAIAPAAKIMLVEASSSSTAALIQAVQVAVKNGATVVSMSWGGGEFSGETSYDSYFAAPGVTFVASAGDSGAGVEWPAASPNVTGVGGTSLKLNSAGQYQSETAWTNSGGGVSVYEAPQPSWQKGWFPSSWTPVNRGVPDVSYLADPNTGVYVVYKGGWYQFGGTSVGAPQWSALIALANQGRASGALSGINTDVYPIANAGNFAINAACFHDITSGSDGNQPDDYSGPGYDLVTGVGSPVASNFVPALAAGIVAPQPVFALAVTPVTSNVVAGTSASYAVAVSGSNGYNGTVSFSVSGLPEGASATFSPASVTASGASSLAVETATAAPAGTYPITITGTDATGAAHSVKTTLTITSPPLETITVSQITHVNRSAGMTLTLTIVTLQGAPVPNATVSITLDQNGIPYSEGTGETDAAGTVIFAEGQLSVAPYQVIVTAVTAQGCVWNGAYPKTSFKP